uniref:THAP domain-containing protein 1 n=1 Tax=Pygocentrus nattereri TaxID=42514 RepID=A0A3B4DHG4_PYGNA
MIRFTVRRRVSEWTPCTHGCDFNGSLSFHSFPARSDLRSQWLINIRRDQFTISPHTKVCSRHFIPDHLIEPKTPEGRRRLTKDAVPLLFDWNGYSIQAPRLSVWERRERPADPASLEDPSTDLTVDHDYCSAPEPSSLDMSCAENEDLSREVEELRNQLHELRVQLTFGLQRFSGSGEDIRFYTRFPGYDHLMAFWWLIEPSIHKMVRVSRAKAAAKKNEDVSHSRMSGV